MVEVAAAMMFLRRADRTAGLDLLRGVARTGGLDSRERDAVCKTRSISKRGAFRDLTDNKREGYLALDGSPYALDEKVVYLIFKGGGY